MLLEQQITNVSIHKIVDKKGTTRSSRKLANLGCEKSFNDVANNYLLQTLAE